MTGAPDMNQLREGVASIHHGIQSGRCLHPLRAGRGARADDGGRYLISEGTLRRLLGIATNNPAFSTDNF